MEQSSTLSLQQPATSVQPSTKNSTITIKNSYNACEDDYVCHDGPILAGTNTLIFFILIFFLNFAVKCLKCLIGYKLKKYSLRIFFNFFWDSSLIVFVTRGKHSLPFPKKKTLQNNIRNAYCFSNNFVIVYTTK